jgi:SdrD B-like protein/type IX secretion system substrate protein
MKKVYRLIGLSTLFLLILFSPLPAQPWRANLGENETNFYKIRAEFNKYWSSGHFDIRGGEERKPWIPFKRWEWFMEPRVYPTGELPPPGIVQNRMKQYRSGLSVQAAAGGSWTQLGPAVVPSGGGGEGRVNVIAIDPSNTAVVWAGTASGGLWKSTNSGSTWSTGTDNFGTLGISSIAFDPTNSNTMYVATGDADALDTYSMGVLKSTDGGVSWNTTGLSWTTSQGYSIYSIVPHPVDPNILLAEGRQGIFRTTDAGSSWVSVMPGNFKDLEVDPADPTVWYAARYGVGVYKSTNTGVSFTQLTSGLPSSGFTRIAVALSPSQSSTVYALYVNANSGFYGLYLSTNSGGSWSLQSNSPQILSWDTSGPNDGQGWYDLVLQVAPDNPATLYVGGINLWKSTSGGTSWTSLTNWYSGTPKPYVHADQHALAFLPGVASTMFAGNDGGVFLSTNSGVNWTDRSSGIAATQFYRLGGSATNASRVLAGAQDNGTDRYLTGSWSQVMDGDGMEALIDYSNENIGYGEYYYGAIYKTMNGGNTFSSIAGSIPDTGGWVTPFIINPLNPRSLYVGETGVYKTTNRGSSWTTLTSSLGGSSLVSLAIAPTDTNTLYAATGSRVWVTTNGGSVWSEITSGLPTGSAAVTYLAVHPSDAATAYATFSGYGSQKVFRTTNTGSSWTNISTGLPAIPANCIAINSSVPNQLYVGTDAGVFYSPNGGSSWSSFSSGLPDVIVNELEIHQGAQKLRAATYGRGLWESPLAVAATGSISGMKFQDMNGNGVKDLPDTGLAGWTIQLTIATPAGTMMTTTDVSGNYSFQNLDAGSYTVEEVAQPGWTQTLPVSPSSYSVVLGAGENAVGFDFGNFLQPASVTGTVFEDLNGDSIKQISEPGLPNWRVRISGGAVDSVLTDPSGNYSFTNLAPGNYTLDEALQPGWHRSRPAGGSYSISLGGGDHLTGRDFGNYRYGSIGGLKFNDLNINGVRDSGEAGIKDWVMHLTGPVSLSSSTDSSGVYSFDSIPPGTYTLSETVEVGWAQTLPPGNASYPVAMTSGLDTSGFIFGNHFSPEKIYGVLDGWNLLSLPRLVADPHKHSVYPSAISNAFAYAGGYQRIDTLSNGPGFWLKFPSIQNIFIDGTAVTGDTVDLANGWNIIGALTTSVPVSGIVQDPTGIVTSNYFSYGSLGYEIADSLLPHHGYWVRTHAAGQLLLTAGPAATGVAAARELQAGSSTGEKKGTITVSDTRGRSRILYIGCGGLSGQQERSFDLPPVPPDDAYDVRYSSGSQLASCGSGQAREFSILISSAAYPLRIDWDLADQPGAATLVIDRREIAMSPAGSITLETPPSRVGLRLGPSATAELPVRFSVSQNYPNPFNPVTTVSFEIGQSSPVTLKVYDVLGREVATLVDEVRERGTYRAEWDAGSFPSGVYTYRLRAGGFVAVKKMILMR